MSEKKKRINAVIDEDLYIKVIDAGYGITEAITSGFTKLLEPAEEDNKTEMLQNQIETLITEIEILKKKEQENRNILQEKESRIKELQDQIKVKDDQLKVKNNDEHQLARIEDLKAQIQGLNDQLQMKDKQIKDQNENMHKQAVHIQSLIQENSRLNLKLLPEHTEKKKPFWKFW